MTDLQHVPLHIRCTDRHLIDPDYPDDDAKWWRLQSEAKRELQYTPGDKPSGTSERQLRVLHYLQEHGERSVSDIRRDLGYTYHMVTQAVNGLAHSHRIYEDMVDGLTYYGVDDV